MPVPNARGRSKRSTPPPTRKTAQFFSREPGSDAWEPELVTMTAFNSNGGALALFYRGTVKRILAPGFWSNVTVIDEGPISDYDE